MTLLLTLATLGCGTSTTVDSDDTAGANAVTVDDVAFTIDYSCPYQPNTLVDQVSPTALDSCIYRRESQELNVWLTDGGAVNVYIKGFDGVGTYTTGATESDTQVNFLGTSGTETSAGNVRSWGDPTHPCDIEVLRTNLDTVPIPEGGATTGWFELKVTCPELGGVAAEPYTCTLEPDTFTFAIAACEASLL